MGRVEGGRVSRSSAGLADDSLTGLRGAVH